MKIKNICLLLASAMLFTFCGSDDPNPGPDPEPEVPEVPKEEYVNVTYTPSSSIISNPERGFYTHKEFSTSGNDNGAITASMIDQYRQQNITLFLTIYYMQDFRDKLISDDFLQRIRSNMEALRTGGAKAVLRFAYTDSMDEADKPWDAPWELTQQHIQQLKPILQEYSDIIYVMEAGFVGSWGEWYYTDYYNFETVTVEDYQPRRILLDALLDALPSDRMICVRTPAAKMKMYNLSLKDTLTANTAYNNLPYSRIAAHNDCFMANNDDNGTYGGNNRDLRRFWQYDTRYTIMGGETCSFSTYSQCSNTLSEMEKYHWSYINIDYHKTVINDWVVNGCMDEIKRRLGYRLVLTEGTFTNGGEAGNPFEVKLKMTNEGWAAPMNPRNVEIIFTSTTNSSEKYKLNLDDVDPRYWFSGEEINLDLKFKLPESMALGEYNVYLNLPDPYENLSTNPAYSIQLATEGVWEEQTGYNKLTTVTVSEKKTTENFTGKTLAKF